MARLEDLTKGALVRGVLTDRAETPQIDGAGSSAAPAVSSAVTVEQKRRGHVSDRLRQRT